MVVTLKYKGITGNGKALHAVGTAIASFFGKGKSLELQRFTEAVMKESNKVIRVIFCCLKCVTTILSMNMITPAFKILKPFDDTGTVGSQFPRFGERVAGGVGKVEAASIELDNG